jgi:hypothetical protein
MSLYDNCDNYENPAQHIEGFNNGLDHDDNLYQLTPEATEQQTELDESIYNEHYDENDIMQEQEQDQEQEVVESVSAPVESNSTVPKVGFSLYEYITNKDNRRNLLLALLIVCAGLYYLVYCNYIQVPALAKNLGQKLGVMSASSSSFAATSTSLGKNYMKMNPLL